MSSNVYKYMNKGKLQTFNLDELTPEQRAKFNKMGDTQKRRYIASFKLSNESPMFDIEQVKTTNQYKPQNEKTNKWLLEKRKKEELDKLIKSDEALKNEKVKDVKDIIIAYTNYITADDLLEAINKNENMTIGELQQLYIDKVNELNINNAENVNISKAENVNFNKLALDINKLTKIIDDPLKDSLKDIVNKFGTNEAILNAADKNDIVGLIEEIKKINSDDKTIKDINDKMDFIIQSMELLGMGQITRKELQELLTSKSDKEELIKLIKEEFGAVNESIKSLKDDKMLLQIINDIKHNKELTHEQKQHIWSACRSIFADIKEFNPNTKNDIESEIIQLINGAYVMERGELKFSIPRAIEITNQLINNYNNYYNRAFKSTQKNKFNNYLDILKSIQPVLVNTISMANTVAQGEGIKDVFKGMKKIPQMPKEIEELRKEIEELRREINEMKKTEILDVPKASDVPKVPEILEVPAIYNHKIEIPKIIPLKDSIENFNQAQLKPIDIKADNEFKKTDDELTDLKRIMADRRQDIEYSEDEEEDEDWGEGLKLHSQRILKRPVIKDFEKMQSMDPGRAREALKIYKLTDLLK